MRAPQRQREPTRTLTGTATAPPTSPAFCRLPSGPSALLSLRAPCPCAGEAGSQPGRDGGRSHPAGHAKVRRRADKRRTGSTAMIRAQQTGACCTPASAHTGGCASDLAWRNGPARARLSRGRGRQKNEAVTHRLGRGARAHLERGARGEHGRRKGRRRRKRRGLRSTHR